MKEILGFGLLGVGLGGALAGAQADKWLYVSLAFVVLAAGLDMIINAKIQALRAEVEDLA